METKVLTKKQAFIHEIFASTQGEGLYLGKKQIFVRFSLCNLQCAYCDTDNSVVHPFSIEKIAQEIERLFWKEGDIHSVSLTGGEPLLYPHFIEMISETVRSLKAPLFLETNGTLPKAIEVVKDCIDILSMDLKLSSVGFTRSYFKEHQQFLALTKGKDRYIKMVLSDYVDENEFLLALDLIAKEDQSIPTFLQPVTPCHGVPAVSEEKLEKLTFLAKEKLTDVHVQPQWHKIWGVK